MNARADETESPFYTVKQAAAIAYVSEATVRDQCRKGEIPCYRVGRRILIPKKKFLSDSGVL